MFFQHVDKGAAILDLGCGSGRDSKFFIDNGFTVEAIDGSYELCKSASRYIGQPVRHIMFQDLDYVDKFDGIWACASLLHIPIESLPEILDKISLALKHNGILYASFKYGDFSGERNGRIFTDLDEAKLEDILKLTNGLHILQTTLSYDVRPDRNNEKWLNVIIKKIL